MTPDTPKLDDDIYQLVAIKYATNQKRTGRDNFLASHDQHDGPMPMDFFIWAAISKDRIILIDSGADKSTCDLRGHEFLRCPAQTLLELGIDPLMISDVIVTHMHWDHMGNMDKFPNATLHIHKSELAHATGCGMCHPLLRRPYDVEQVCTVVRALYGGRVSFNAGKADIAPGITAHHVGGHTPGLQVVRVRTQRGYVLLASDAMHYYANSIKGNPFPVVVNVQEYLDAFGSIASLADSDQHVIAGHDPVVMELFPAWTPESEGIAVRLDVQPLRVVPSTSARH